MKKQKPKEVVFWLTLGVLILYYGAIHSVCRSLSYGATMALVIVGILMSAASLFVLFESVDWRGADVFEKVVACVCAAFVVFFLVVPSLWVPSMNENNRITVKLFENVRREVKSALESGADFRTIANAKDVAMVVPSLQTEDMRNSIWRFSVEPLGEGGFEVVAVKKDLDEMSVGGLRGKGQLRFRVVDFQ